MNFVSWAFVGLFAVTFLARLTIGRRKIEPRLRRASCSSPALVFYGWHVPVYLLILVGTALLDYGVALAIDRLPLEARARAAALAAGVAGRQPRRARLLQVRRLRGARDRGPAAAAGRRHRPAARARAGAADGHQLLHLPVAVLHHRRLPRPAARRSRSFPRFLLFISFFPQLVAGPIVRATEFLPQIARPRRLRLRVFYDGVWLLIGGFFLKMVCADNLAAYVDEYWARGSRPDTDAHFRAVAGADVLGADLRRLLRLLDHRPRPRLPARLPLPDQLRRPVHRRHVQELLGALAHHAVALAARLPVRAARRQPRLARRGRWPTCCS